LKILYLPNEYSQQRQREKKRWIYPVRMAMEAEYYRQHGHKVIWLEDGFDTDYNTIRAALTGKSFFYDKIIEQPEGLPFLSLPHPDRIFTNAFGKIYQNNGNFKYHPGTYIQSANGCWHGRCTFCVEQNNKWEVRPVDDVIEEIKQCKALGFKEVFDDSGTLPVGDWLDTFCNKMVRLNIRFSCNLRLMDIDYNALRVAGFRMVLFGLQSANQKTLDIINKGTNVNDVKYIIKAAKAGLEPHIAVMFGYPWESDSDAINTLKLVWWLLKKGYAKTAQASFYSPLDSKNIPSHTRYIKHIYRVARYPEFWLNKLRDIHNIADLKYLWRMIKEGLKGGA
jgi:radical SAM superfamily enzyme YgiQ (UPF0313 family)